MRKFAVALTLTLIITNFPMSNALAISVEILEPQDGAVFHHRNVSIHCVAHACCKDLLVYWEWIWTWNNGSYKESGWLNYTLKYEFYINISLYPGWNKVEVLVKSNRDLAAMDNITLYYDGPLAEVNGPYYGKVGQVIEFNGTAYGGSKPYRWFWDFGDGEISEQKNPEHVYMKPGKYMVSFTVTDSNGYRDVAYTWAFIEEDNLPPTVEIVTPKHGLYVNERKILPSPITVVVGKITVEAEAEDNDTGILCVAFYIDGEFKVNVTSPPYTWFMYEKAGIHEIEVIAYDTAMNNATDYVKVLVITKKFIP